MSESANSGILAGTRIVDLSSGIAGPVATMVLAEAGADVVLVEPPGGHADRARPGFLTWHRSKRSVTLDLATTAGLESLRQLLSTADVLVHDLGPERAAGLGLDDATLAVQYPDLIVSSVLGWPANHRHAEQAPDDLLTLARLGICDEQKAKHRPGPIYVRVPLGSWGASWLAAIGIVARLVSRDRTGVAGPAHTSLVQGALIPMMMHWSRAERPSPVLEMGMPKQRMGATLFECADSRWIHVMQPGPEITPLMRATLAQLTPDDVAAAEAGLGDDPPTFANAGALQAAFHRYPAHRWLAELWAHDVPAQLAAHIGEVFDDEQARANRYVIELDDPRVGPITTAGMPLTITPPAQVKGPAPEPGQHTADLLAESRAERVRPTPTGDTAARWPLAGLKVVDFGNFLAGPLGPMLLADLGADVIKVETITGDPMRYVDWSFAGCQRGKRAVALDLKHPESRAALEAIIGWADVVHHNLRMPAAHRLGLDPDSIRAIKPDVVFCHTSSYGPAGPRADWPGYDQLFQSSCGWEVAGAGEGNSPMWHRFGFTDHLCAMSSVVSTLLAVLHRDRTGTPTNVAASLLGAAVMTNSETYVGAGGELEPYAHLDRDQLALGPGRRIVACADGWVAIAADTEADIEKLVAGAGATSPEGITDAVATLEAAVLCKRLGASGVACEPVRLAQRYPFFDDPDNQAAGLVATYDHAEWGRFEQPGAMWHFGDLEARLDRAPPALGEHTVEVLREVGLTADAVDALLASGAAVAR